MDSDLFARFVRTCDRAVVLKIKFEKSQRPHQIYHIADCFNLNEISWKIPYLQQILQVAY